jgi:hypothetical protein
MPDCSDNKNPLLRSGTSQLQRQLSGLKDGYVHIDEREFDNWIIFATQFARYLKYFGATDTEAGNWTAFFTEDVSAVLGSIAVQRVEIYRQDIKTRIDFLKDDDNRLATEALKRNLDEVFSAVFTLAKALDGYLLKINTYNNNNKLSGNTEHILALPETLQSLIKSKLAPALRRLIGYYKAASTSPLNYLIAGSFKDWEILNTPVTEVSTIINGDGLSKVWWIFPASVPEADRNWNKYVQDTAADNSIFLSPALPVIPVAIDGTDPDRIYQRINHAANHNLFTGIFDQFLTGYTLIIQEAEKELLKTLEDWDSHPPHYALFLAFLKLFRFAQTHINTFTQKHLDYYYKEILQLFPKEAEPNQAHILVELAKQVDDYLIAEDTLLKAGKDSAGKEVLYAMDDDETFNKASIAAFKSVYIGSTGDNHKVSSLPGAATINNNGRLFASPVSNSADGAGEELTSENKEWHPIVNKIYSEAKLTDIAMPNAEIGFALASHYLYLTEGKRKVMVKLVTSNNNIINGLDSFVKCYLTAEKEWFEVPAVNIAAGTLTVEGTLCSEISFTLSGDDPAIVNYNAKVHGGTFNVALPIIKIVLKNEDTAAYQYNLVRDVVIMQTEIKVEVGTQGTEPFQDGLKQLLLSNDFGPIDASKPFLPFGAQPKKDSTLVIGNKEAFSKKNSSIKLNLEWAGLPGIADIDYGSDPPYAPDAKVNFLAGGAWISHPNAITIINGATTLQVFSPLPVPANVIADYDAPYDLYGSTSKKGFLRFVLNGTFGHKEYMTALTEHLIKKATDKAYTASGPTEPYSPMLQSVYLSYSSYVFNSLNATTKNTFDARSVQFFHLYPFGDAEQHAYIVKKNNPGQTEINIKLFPQFDHTNTSGVTEKSVGEFYIGFENLAAQQSVNVLFQVLEGSADPLIAKPDDHVNWSYLCKNEWKDFSNQDISDATEQLIQSGIITFKLPSDVITENTILPSGYIWLRACVKEYATAVCALINVHAQAAVVTFSPNNNADDFLDNALPGDSITKLKTPVSSVKKIQQPYSSFGGRVKETSLQYYVRVSERLRHKARAITIWDYEHLVLEAFPQIHKAKCLNHTKYAASKTTNAIEYNEVKPGYVTIITIPNLVNRNDINPLKPYTNQSLIKQIKEYLQQRISCHVQLEVANPQFEEVRLQFFMKLAEGFTDFTYYREKLQNEIVSYLTPWAYNDQLEIQFGGKMYKSSLINFIEERPYVEYITLVQMFHKISDTVPESGNLEEVEASTARSILVSAQAKKHSITEITVNDEEKAGDCATHTKA